MTKIITEYLIFDKPSITGTTKSLTTAAKQQIPCDQNNGIKLWNDEGNTVQITAKCFLRLFNIEIILLNLFVNLFPSRDVCVFAHTI